MWLTAVMWLIPVIASGQPAVGPPNHQADDLAVYSALVNHPSLHSDGSRRAIVVTRELASPPIPLDEFDREQNLRRFLRKPAPSTIGAFLKAIRREGEVPAALGHRRDVTLIASSALARVLEAPGTDYWGTFARHYPNARGILSLSAIAYGDSGNEAMAYLGFSCGVLCGHGLAVVLFRDGSNWVPVEHMYLWES